MIRRGPATAPRLAALATVKVPDGISNGRTVTLLDPAHAGYVVVHGGRLTVYG